MTVGARRDEGGVWPLQSRWCRGISKLVVSGLEGMEGGPLQGSGVSLESPLPPHAQERGVGGSVWDWDTFPRLRSSPFALRSHCEFLSRGRRPGLKLSRLWERGDSLP